MIRLSTPEDTDDIVRLCMDQFKRTPWPMNVFFPPAHAFHVCERRGHIAACLGFRRDGQQIRVMHVWTEDGFAGRRAAVELMLDMEALADAERAELVFNTRAWNIGLRKAVEQHGCKPSRGEDDEMVAYRRDARRWTAA